MFKLLFRTAVLAAAVGLPMLFFSASDLLASAKRSLRSIVGGQNGPQDVTPVTVHKPLSPPLEGSAVQDFGEVFRFDVTTGWVMSRWARVSTGMSQPQLHGYRVPLVTGTRRDDLAGALTYYFGPDQRVRKITFNGTTGDAARLVQTLTRRYGLQRRITNDSGLFVYEAGGDGAKSVLRIRPTDIVKADRPYQRFHVDLSLEPPEKG